MKNELNEISELLGHARRRANAIAEDTKNPTQLSLDRLAEKLNEGVQRLDNLLREIEDAEIVVTKKPKSEYAELSNDEVQDYYANCLTTRQLAGGHGKAHYNGLRVMALLQELESRGQKPDGREGSFNGKGSY